MVTPTASLADLVDANHDRAAGENGLFTDDELNVQLLGVLLSIEEHRQRKGFLIFTPNPYSFRGSDQFRIDAIKADIISTAAAQKRPEYERELERIRIDWAKQSSAPYDPAVTGGWLGEIGDWDVPGVMERRAALRATPLVQGVLKHGLQ